MWGYNSKSTSIDGLEDMFLLNPTDNKIDIFPISYKYFEAKVSAAACLA